MKKAKEMATNPKILIIDDEEIVIDSCTHILANSGYQIITARNGTSGLELMQDVVLHPAFTEDEIERQRQQTLSSIENSKDRPATVANREYNKWLFGDHPYAFPTGGTIASVESLTREDILLQYDRVFMPNNSVLFVVGDIKPKKGFKLAENAFGEWREGEVPKAEFFEVKEPDGYKLRIVNKADATQTQAVQVQIQ